MDYLQYPTSCTRVAEYNPSFKPYYKWITFNTKLEIKEYKIRNPISVLNLIINGLPSILRRFKMTTLFNETVLNLIINGLPSILMDQVKIIELCQEVLNLIINGLPSIPKCR